MINAQLFINAIAMLEEEKGIPKEVIKEALEEALESAYRKEYDPEATVRSEISLTEGTIRLFHVRSVVEVIDDELTEITVKDAQKINPNFKAGDVYETEIDLDEDFSRLAALQVKQVVRQKFREVEKQQTYDK
jgi:N utilization substance protein A